jgi:hypothetical protein
MRLCYISRNYKTLNSAGGKAKTDIELTMQEMGFINLGWKQTSIKNSIIDFFINLSGILLAIIRLKQGDVLLLQYPLKKYYEFVCKYAHRKGAKVITIIHDLGSFRRKKLTIPKEIARLSLSNVIIAHNEKMHTWLIDKGLKRPVIELGIFDYRSNGDVVSSRPLPKGNDLSLFFVGNLSKDQNAFLYTLGKQFKKAKMYLYGNKYEKELANTETTINMGFAKDTDLINSNKGDFGLSWYGESLNSGEGKIGEYMEYNNPHKISLYLRCSAPIIIWSKAGLASFVKREHVGICLDSLTELENKIASIETSEYLIMKKKCRPHSPATR